MKQTLRKNMLLITITTILNLLIAAASVAVALLLQQIIDIALNQNMEDFQSIIFKIIGFVLLLTVLYVFNELCSKKAISKITSQMREKIFNGIFRQSHQDFSSENTADYISALTNDLKLIEDNYILPWLNLILYGATFLMTIAVLLYYSVLVTIVLFGCILIMFIIPSCLGKALQTRQDNLSEQNSYFTAKIKDMFSGYEVVRSFGIIPAILALFHKENQNLTEVKYSSDKLIGINDSISQLLATITQFTSMLVAAYLLIKGQITGGSLVALIQLSSTFVVPISMIMQCVPKIKGIRPVIERLDHFDTYQDQSFTGDKCLQYTDSIRLKELSFSYDSSKDNIHAVEQINVNFQKGKKYAITGTSGCGKSTMTKLMMGYYPGYTGKILIDNQEMKELKIEEINEMYSVIHQNVYMFDGTIYDNITLYNDYSDDQISQALKASGIESFILSKEEGLNYKVGENGKNLSGGQRQRIAIARALIKKTPVLILDEGTSAIDMQTAYDIESRLLKIKDLTLLSITHNMNEDILKSYDQIIYMENGSICESGTLHELLNKNGAFYNFFTLKKESDEQIA